MTEPTRHRPRRRLARPETVGPVMGDHPDPEDEEPQPAPMVPPLGRATMSTPLLIGGIVAVILIVVIIVLVVI